LFPSSSKPTDYPSFKPSQSPSTKPSDLPSRNPSSSEPTRRPSMPPSRKPTVTPTYRPTRPPTTSRPTKQPTYHPSRKPTKSPSKSPSRHPTTSAPTEAPTFRPTYHPSRSPTLSLFVLSKANDFCPDSVSRMKFPKLPWDIDSQHVRKAMIPLSKSSDPHICMNLTIWTPGCSRMFVTQSSKFPCGCLKEGYYGVSCEMEREDIDETFGYNAHIYEAKPRPEYRFPEWNCGQGCTMLKAETGCKDHKNIDLGHGLSPTQCAKKVRQNRRPGRCSMYFMAGGPFGICRCLHVGNEGPKAEAGDFECDPIWTYDGSSLFVVPSQSSMGFGGGGGSGGFGAKNGDTGGYGAGGYSPYGGFGRGFNTYGGGLRKVMHQLSSSTKAKFGLSVFLVSMILTLLIIILLWKYWRRKKIRSLDSVQLRDLRQVLRAEQSE